MTKGKADRGVRTEDSAVMDKQSVSVTDGTSGDEGIDDQNPKNKAEPGALVPDDQTTTPPGPAFKDKHDIP